MAQVYTSDFEGATLGSLPAGWTVTYGNWGVNGTRPTGGSKGLTDLGGTNSSSCLYTGIAARVDEEFSNSYKPAAWSTSGASARFAHLLRCKTDLSTFIGIDYYPGPSGGVMAKIGYRLSFGGYINITTIDLTASTSALTSATATSHTLHIKSRVVGAVISVKAWLDNDAEPAYQTVTDSNVATSGYAGLWFLDGETAGGVTISADDVVIDDTAAAPTSYTLTGPSSGVVGVASTNFTITTNIAATSSIVFTPSDGGNGGTFTPSTVTITAGNSTGTFTYTPASSGVKTISTSDNAGLTDPASVSYTANAAAATAITYSGPSGGTTGVASTNFTATANGSLSSSVTVNLSDGGAGGTFTPSSLTLTSGSTSSTFTYTPASTGVKTLSFTNTGSLTNSPTSLSYTSSAAAATALTWSTNPSSGTVSVASSNFTIAANGSLSSSVIVTPSDGGAGGSFSPSTVTLSSGTLSASFTYTPSTTGARTISVTNNGGLSNPAGVTYTSNAAGSNAISVVSAMAAYPVLTTAGQPSPTMRVTVSGSFTGSVIITPQADVAGMTFTPSSLTLTQGQTGAFSFSASTAGNYMVSVTNDRSFTNPSAIWVINSASDGSVPCAVDDVKIIWSPQNWDYLAPNTLQVGTKCMQSNTTGSYFKVKWSGSASAVAFVDVSNYLSYPDQLPKVRVIVDKGAPVDTVLTTSSVSIAMTGAGNGTHEAEVYFLGACSNMDRWGSSTVSPGMVLRITQINLAAGGTLLQATRRPGGYWLIYGDSITQGAMGISATEPNDHVKSYAFEVLACLNRETGIIACGGQGYEQGGGGTTAWPPFPSSWNYYSAGRARSFSSPPDGVLVLHGANGTTTSSDVSSMISNMRAAFGANCWIFMAPPPHGYAASAIQTGVNNYNTSNPSDNKVSYIDYLSDLSYTTSIHPDAYYHAYFGGILANKMTVAMAAVGGGSAVYPASNYVISGQSYGPSGTEYTGNVTLPSASTVRAGTSYGASGTQYSGTVTLPTAAQVQTGVQFGAGGNQYTGTYAGSGGGSAVFPTAAQVLTGVTFGPNGSDYTGTVVLPSAAQVLSGIGFGASGSLSGTITLPTASQVLSGVSFGPGSATSGNVVMPSASNVRSGVQYGVSGTGSTGNVTLPAAGDVRSGTQYGSAGTQYTGTLSTAGGGGTYPAASQVIVGVSYGPSGSDYTGNVTLPSASQVQAGVGYGAAGTQYVGLLTTGGVVAAGQVPNGRYLRVGA